MRSAKGVHASGLPPSSLYYDQGAVPTFKDLLRFQQRLNSTIFPLALQSLDRQFVAGLLGVTSRHFDAARLMSALTTSGHTAGRRTALCGSGTAVGFGGDGAVQGAATRTAGPSASRRVGLWVISGAGPARHRAARTRGRFLLRAVEAAVTQSIA